MNKKYISPASEAVNFDLDCAILEASTLNVNDQNGATKIDGKNSYSQRKDWEDEWEDYEEE